VIHVGRVRWGDGVTTNTRDAGIKLQAGKRAGNNLSRTWSIVLSPFAFRGLSGVNIPGESWVMSMTKEGEEHALDVRVTLEPHVCYGHGSTRASLSSADGEKSAKPGIGRNRYVARRARRYCARARGVSCEQERARD
jgi:hypothetical protein